MELYKDCEFYVPPLIADELETITDPFISFIDDNTLDNTTYAFHPHISGGPVDFVLFNTD